MYATWDEIGTRLRCPDCETLNRVEPPPPPPPRPQRREVGQYRVGSTDWRHGRTGREANEPRMTVKCPVCGTRLHLKKRQAGKRARCPDCDTRFVLPAWRSPEKRSPPPPVEETYSIGEAPERPPVSPVAVSGNLAGTSLPPEPRGSASAPRNAVEFLLTPSVFRRWMVASAGVWVVVVLLFLAAQAARSPQHANIIAAGALALCALWPTIWYVSFSASTGLAILEQTASEAETLEHWPESDWRHGFFAMLYVGFQGLVAGTVASAATQLAAAIGGPRAVWIWPLAFQLVFPVLLLSALENDTPLGVFSLPVWQSLWHRWRSWAVLHIKAALLLGAISMPVVLIIQGMRSNVVGATFALYVSLLYVGPAATTLWMVYARWLGELAWHITHPPEGANDNREAADEDTHDHG